MKFAIADPPYLGRAERWYGANGCGNGHGIGKADEHPEAAIWDSAKAHLDLVHKLETEFDGWAIAMSVHSLSTYMEVVKTDSRNGIRVMSWIKPSSVPSGNRIGNTWEPVIVKVPAERRSHGKGKSMKDHLIANSLKSGFIGAKPPAWTEWVLDAMGFREGDEITDLFNGSGAVMNAIMDKSYRLDLDVK